ncbi:YugN-like family protein [Mechercharimyces sp. CAU 1602]|uniref:YugN-like family protein n=1 Tax=Mechercharimyces sp. CAU 1602 TaxID=2973933 RepID=UPI002163D519|nr:YugN-like family protein [Mechercharimyces sp. CAU 1602]MCS1350147.1 YugN-like family protein [Mechercharimyces sp. CAU 1602]
MIIDDAGIKGIKKSFGELEHSMKSLGFARWSWDYSKAYYDLKLPDDETKVDYYLRIRADVVDGVLEKKNSTVKLHNPLFVRHFFPHGMDPEAEIPEKMQQTVEEAVSKVKEVLA